MKKASLLALLLIGLFFVSSVVKAKSDVECSLKADNKECGPRKHCVKTADNNKYHCVCKPGYVANGDSCKDVDECKNKETRIKCKEKGATCENKLGSYKCKCPKGYAMHHSKHVCEDYDECEHMELCHLKAICHNTRGSYRCTCMHGFAGDGEECVEDIAYKQKQKIRLIIMIGGAAGGGVLLIIALIAFCCCARKRNKKEKDGEKLEKMESTLSEYGQDWESSEDSDEDVSD
ncbi:hypothetical protein OS493_008945 [Desmophyllum pertusum]|uniref:EGF-like domain-containing protein n=1 Tax=Desmophyllum pertusum TaxID=174260 RepID=A0A9W9ZH95_9CNID|nr:hypothetical protein OS493_008945 [Desmophyllum pertusum]